MIYKVGTLVRINPTLFYITNGNIYSIVRNSIDDRYKQTSQVFNKNYLLVGYKFVAKTHRQAYGMKATYTFYLSFA